MPAQHRLTAALGTTAVLAALLVGGGSALAQGDEQPPLSCAQALQKLNAAEAADATETDGSDTTDGAEDALETDGSDATDGAEDQLEADGSDSLDGAEDIPELGDFPPFGPDDSPELDGSDTPETDGSDAVETDGSDVPDGAADVAETDGSDTPEDGEIAPADRQAAIGTARTLADAACQGPKGDKGDPGVPAQIVIADRECAEVILTTRDGTLVRVIRQIPCPKDCPPAPATRPQVGDSVTRIVNRVPAGTTITLPGSTPAPVPSPVTSDLVVTH